MKLLDYITGSRSGEKANRIERQAMHDPLLYEVLDGYERVPHDTGKALENLRKEVRKRTAKHRWNLTLWSSAASILILIITGGYFFFTTNFIDPDNLVSQEIETHSVPEISIVPETTVTVEIQEEATQETAVRITVPEKKTEIQKVEKPVAIQPETESKPETSISIENRRSAQPYIYIAGTGEVFGVITDEKGEPIIGASVVIKGTDKGITTDMDGYFALQAEIGNELEISYIGYQTLTVLVEEGNLHVAMREDKYVLDEVVVIGYGTTAKKSLTGTVSHTKSRKLKKGPKPKPVEGYKALKKYIRENKKYAGKAKVVLLFTIDSYDHPENIVVKKSTSEEAAGEAIRLLKEGPLWSSGNREKQIKYTIHFKP